MKYPSHALRFAGLAVAIAATLALGSRLVRPNLAFGQAPATAQAPTANCTSPTNQYVSMTITYPNGTTQTTNNIPWITNATVTLAMENAQSINSSFSYNTAYYCPYGQYVTTINGMVESGDSYWALSINGQEASYGIDTQPLSPGDSIGWSVVTWSAEKTKKLDSHQHQLLLRHRAARIAPMTKATK